MSLIEFARLFVFLLLLGLVLYYEVRCLVLLIFKKKFPASRMALVAHGLAVVGVICFLYGYCIEPYWLEVRHVDISTPKLTHEEITIVQISDLHCDTNVRNEKRLAGIINGLNPDIIVFTGDALNTPRAMALFKQTMFGLKAAIGKYAVRGNYDVWYGKGAGLFVSTGFTELDGRTVVLSKGRDTFTLSGLSVMNFYRDVPYSAIPRDTYNVMAYHYPGLHERIPDAPIDLYLSGHTHGGQVALPWYGAVITFSEFGKKYEAGRYNIDGKILYVNRGIGMEGGLGPRVRFLSRPEITVFHVHPAE